MRHFRHAAHVFYAFVALHLSILATDNFKAAYIDVGLDHGLQFVEHATHVMDGEAR